MGIQKNPKPNDNHNDDNSDGEMPNEEIQLENEE